MNTEILAITEDMLFKSMNKERMKMGRRGLSRSKLLRRASRAHSVQMARDADLVHSKDLAGVMGRRSWSSLGENIGVAAYGEVISPHNGELLSVITEEDAAGFLHEAWMQSDDHRHNILKRNYRRAGIGVVASDNRSWATVIFWA